MYRAVVACILWLSWCAPDSVQAQDAMHWPSVATAAACAAREERPMLVYIHADWCVPCRRMERGVFPVVEPLLRRFARAGLVFDDVESIVSWKGVDVPSAGLAKQLGAHATPAFVFLDSQGSQILRAVGYHEAERFALILAYVVTGAYRHADFETYEIETPPNLSRVSAGVSDVACSASSDSNTKR